MTVRLDLLSLIAMANTPLIIVAAALGWPVVRMVWRADLGRALRSSRWAKVFLVGVLGIYGVALLATALAPPGAGWVLALGAVIVLAVYVLRGRPNYGSWWRWPPGVLAPMDRMDQVDVKYLLECARDHGPIFKATQTLRPAAHVVGLKQGADLLRQHGGRLSRGRMRFSNFIPKGFIRFMDQESHDHYRPLLAQVTAPDVIERSLASIATSARLELARIAALDHGDQAAGIVLREQMPGAVLRIFLKEFFGINQDSDEMSRFEELYRQLDCRNLLKQPDHIGKAALESLADLVSGAARRKEHPGSYFQAHVDRMPETLDDRTLIGNIVGMVHLGSYDVASLIIWNWKYLSDWPEWQDKLFKLLEAGRDKEADALSARIVSETLRLDQSEFIKRRSTEAFDFAGYRIPKDWGVQVCLRESHQDPDVFENPRHFDPDRFLRHSYGQDVYAPFGVGATSCTARGLTCAVAETWVRELSANYTWTIAADGPRQHDGFHWAPAENFAVSLTRRMH